MNGGSSTPIGARKRCTLTPSGRLTLASCARHFSTTSAAPSKGIASCPGRAQDLGLRSGLGYAERLVLTIPPWKLPIETLRWGRFLSPSDWIVWIDWQGEHPQTIVYRNGARVAVDELGDEQIRFCRVNAAGDGPLVDHPRGSTGYYCARRDSLNWQNVPGSPFASDGVQMAQPRTLGIPESTGRGRFCHPREGELAAMIGKKILYGALFVVMLPTLLVVWAAAARANVSMPLYGNTALGSVFAALGLTLILIGMWELWRLGSGLPMNALPRPGWSRRECIASFPIPSIRDSWEFAWALR